MKVNNYPKVSNTYPNYNKIIKPQLDFLKGILKKKSDENIEPELHSSLIDLGKDSLVDLEKENIESELHSSLVDLGKENIESELDKIHAELESELYDLVSKSLRTENIIINDNVNNIETTYDYDPINEKIIKSIQK